MPALDLGWGLGAGVGGRIALTWCILAVAFDTRVCCEAEGVGVGVRGGDPVDSASWDPGVTLGKIIGCRGEVGIGAGKVEGSILMTKRT